MRSNLKIALVLVFALLAACAGPRLASSATTAHLPAPVVQRLDTPPVRTRGVPWPVPTSPDVAADCDT